MHLERYLAQFEARDCACLYTLTKLGADKMFVILKEMKMDKNETTLFMLNYSNLSYFDGNASEYHVTYAELPAWMQDYKSA